MGKKSPAISAFVFLAVMATVITLQPPAYAQESPAVIRFAVFPYKSPRTIFNLFAPIAARIEEKTGKKVELVSAADYDSFMGKAKEGGYDLLLPCVNCFFLIQPAGYQIIARGEPPFYGAAIVRKDSDITSLEQLKGKKIAAIGRHSYAGYMFFKQQLADRGISPEKDVQFNFLNKVDSIIFSVLNRQYEIGVIKLEVLESPAFDAVRDKVRIISRSGPIPQFPFVVKNTMDPATVARIREVLMALNAENPQDKDILQSLQIHHIVTAEDADYDAFHRELLKTIE